MGMSTKLVNDGKTITIITQQYVTGLYVAIYEKGNPIPTQASSQKEEVAYHRWLRKKYPGYIKESSSIIPEKTVVIFRKFPKGEVVALFPEIQANNHHGECLCYQHVGQHGPASYSMVDRTKLASAAEYAELKTELESIGYDLLIRKRINKRWYEVPREVR